MKYVAILNGKKYEVEIEKVNEYEPLSRDAAVAPTTPQPIQRTVKQEPVQVAPVKEPISEGPVIESGSEGSNEVTSPMPGNMWEVKVSVGESVAEGQVLFILEAMKMENEIVAPVAGKVSSVMVKKGDAVDTDQVLAVID